MQQVAPQNTRVESLDGLRGIAALAVVFSHALLSQPVFWDNKVGKVKNETLTWISEYTPLPLLWAGDKAVLLFFVLSGFVLTLPWTAGRNRSYGSFLTSRFCRIYIPYCAAMLIAAILATVLGGHPVPGGSDWINGYGWAGRVSEHTLPSVLLVLLNQYCTWLNNPTWSLVWEMRVSLIFPLLVIPVIRWGLPGAAVVAACLWAAFSAGQTISAEHPDIASYTGDPHKTFFYAGYFLVGAVMAKYRNVLSRIGSAKNGAVATTLFVAGMAYWLLRWPATAEMLKIPGAILVIMAAISAGPISRWLNRPTTQWLGRVSYSLYLVHVPVILSMDYLLNSYLSQAVIVALAVVLSLAVAEVFYRTVERPAHELGKYLTSRRGAQGATVSS